MSVFFVTDDSDDGIHTSKYEYLYQQIKNREYHSSSIESSFSIVINPKSYHCRRRDRPQQCSVNHLLTYMFTLLLLFNHLHWPIIFFSLSSVKFMSTYAATISTTFGTNRSRFSTNGIEQQCLPIDISYVNRLCSKTCRSQRTPYETPDNIHQLLLDSRYLPFCSSYALNYAIDQTKTLNELSESKCRQTFRELMTNDEEARQASTLFSTYIEAIDSASDENRYSIIRADCQQAYRRWACSVQIPYFYQNHRIMPCQTICDGVERVCPTFRPSEREPLFAGQPLFYCSGGIVANSDYGQRPHCFDMCHITNGLFLQHSITSSSSSPKLAHRTGQTCFDIELLPQNSFEQSSLLSSLSNNETIFNRTNNTSMVSASAASLRSLLRLCIIVNILPIIIIF